MIIFLSVLACDLLVMLVFFLRPLYMRGKRRRAAEAHRILAAALEGMRPAEDPRARRFIRANRWTFMDECLRVSDTVACGAGQKAAVQEMLARSRLDVALIRDLNSARPFRRMRAAVHLPLMPGSAPRALLLRALEAERSRAVRLTLASSLTALHEAGAIPTIIDSLAGQPMRFQESLWGLLSEFGEDLEYLLPMLEGRQEKEIQLFLIHFAGRYPSARLKSYLLSRVDSPDLDICHSAFRTLCAAYPASLDHARFMTHDDFLIRNLAAEALGALPTVRSLTLLFERLDDLLIRKSAALALSAILRARPQHFRAVMLRCVNERRENARTVLVEVLAGFVDYLMEKLLSHDSEMIGSILLEIMSRGRIVSVVNFLNKNANPDIERSALELMRRFLEADPKRVDELAASLRPELLLRLGIPARTPAPNAGKRPAHPNRPLLYVFLGLGAGLAPLLCAAAVLLQPGSLGRSFLPGFLRVFSSAFAVYAAVLNTVYMLLLLFSWIGVRRQARQRSLLSLSFLFKENILPSISIIAPAYNEESSIVESVSSLLTLRYPDYEVIVVNDGSRDATLQRLVSYFELERTDLFVHKYLNTQEILGIYANPLYPELLVIDKANGGKADALNTGINAARKQYFAGIDSDSMLERDALLNLAGQFVFSEEEVVAAGGNILPINGCAVRKGAILETSIPPTAIGRFQTVEYLRAFMAGRVGWAAIKSLLIISGAFGLFHRRRVVDAHGYLTRAEHYMKDTVGEDMELVVRLIRRLREDRIPHSVQYVYDANCWTEIPESMRVLGRQRDRWMRGLLDIVTFHSRVIMNPRYGRLGLLGFPYFILFEVLGPWFEAEGYPVLILSLILGMIGTPLFLLAFAATVLLGLLVSVMSMIIVEHRRQYFRFKDKMLLVLYALLENLGFRQVMSLLRVRGFMRMAARVGGWGNMERRGLRSAEARGKEGKA